MPFIIGTDEAGYGPNLGPLVVGASLWRVPEGIADLYDELQSNICRTQSGSRIDGKIPICDSKDLFQSRGCIGKLERSVITMLGVVDRVPANLFDVFQQVASQNSNQLAGETTYRWDDVTVPVACDRDEVDGLVLRVRDSLADRSVACRRIAATVLFPGKFNQGLRQFGNKANLLSSITCRLVRSLIDSIESNDRQKVTVLCDKHGGRAHYAGLIQQEMTESLVRVFYESRGESCYGWREAGQPVEMKFMAKGERHLPIALASMVAKYLRELSMEAWNLFWKEQMPSLRPTAGYPQDAKRFKKEITIVQSRLSVDDRVIWREK